MCRPLEPSLVSVLPPFIGSLSLVAIPTCLCPSFSDLLIYRCWGEVLGRCGPSCWIGVLLVCHPVQIYHLQVCHYLTDRAEECTGPRDIPNCHMLIPTCKVLSWPLLSFQIKYFLLFLLLVLLKILNLPIEISLPILTFLTSSGVASPCTSLPAPVMSSCWISISESLQRSGQKRQSHALK